MPTRPLLFLATVCVASHFVTPCEGVREVVSALSNITFREQDLRPQAGSQVTIRAYWMRHGTSCANIIREFADLGLGVLTQHTYADPSLTDCAIKHAQRLGNKILEVFEEESKNWTSPLMIFSSVLVRSMETALYNFPGMNVYPIPFIAENDKFRDNTPLDWVEQNATKLHRPPNAPEMINRLKFDDEINPSNDPCRDNEYKNDYNAFKREFPKMLSLLVPAKYIKSGAIIPVVIVSHSAYMLKNLRCGVKKPRNNEVWVKDYSVELLRRKQLCGKLKDKCWRGWGNAPAMEESSTECGPDLMNREVYPKYHGIRMRNAFGIKVSRPCGLDVDRCSKFSMFPSNIWKNRSCCEEVSFDDWFFEDV